MPVNVVLLKVSAVIACCCPSGPARIFEALDSDPELVRIIDAHSPVSRLIQLKVGAQVGLTLIQLHHACLCVLSLVKQPGKLFVFLQVMLTKNLDVGRGLVNGARGVVINFETGKHGLWNFVFYYSVFVEVVIADIEQLSPKQKCIQE